MSSIETLKRYKYLSEKKSTQLELIRDKKAILYAATLLDSDDTETLNLCLDILQNCAENEATHSFLVSTFGIYESLESLSIRMRDMDKAIFQRAIKLTEILRSAAPPAYNTRNRLKHLKMTKKQQLFILSVEGLNGENLLELEDIMVRIKGIVSFLVDIETKRCTVRICSKLEIKEVVEKIYVKTNLKCFVVVRNKKTGSEDFIDFLELNPNTSYLEYPDEVLSPKGKAITEPARRIVQSGNNIIKSVINMWNDAFYW